MESFRLSCKRAPRAEFIEANGQDEFEILSAEHQTITLGLVISALSMRKQWIEI